MKFKKTDRKPNSRLLLHLAALVAIVVIMIVLTWKFELYKVVAGLISVLFLSGGSDANAVNAAKNVCLEPGCVLAAADIINALDEKVDPCSGKWSAVNFGPAIAGHQLATSRPVALERRAKQTG